MVAPCPCLWYLLEFFTPAVFSGYSPIITLGTVNGTADAGYANALRIPGYYITVCSWATQARPTWPPFLACGLPPGVLANLLRHYFGLFYLSICFDVVDTS